MSNKNISLIIDAGNTSIKCALISNNIIYEKKILYSTSELIEHYSKIKYNNALLSSVLDSDSTKKIHNSLPNINLIENCKVPIKINYKSPTTLGNDRLANAIYAKYYSEYKSSIVIDIGTCIKFDYINNEGEYFGGSISPGIDLRYKALHYYTGKLPLENKKDKINILGTNTSECLRSGVINGIKGEIQHFINEYESKNKDLTIFLTGGDQIYFDISSKKTIFAVENLTLLGLNIILQANVS